MSSKLDYQWALECWREMMAKYEAGRQPPTPSRTALRLLLADARQALYDAVEDGDTRELRCAGGRAFQVMGQAIDALASPDGPEAATLIEAQQGRIEGLEAALRKIRDLEPGPHFANQAAMLAAAALSPPADEKEKDVEPSA